VSEDSLTCTLPRVHPAPRRAAALPPDERRKALIAATLPLVLAHGPEVSTRQIAEVAGVAEGTIFRVFPTKDDLIDAVVASAFDPSALIEAIARVDRSAPLEQRLVAAVELMQERSRQLAHLLHAVAPHGRPDRGSGGRDGRFRAAEARLVDALALLIDPDRDRLRSSSQETARRLRLITTALSHPRFVEDRPLPPHEIVSLLLDGMRVRPGTGSAAVPGTIPSIGASSC
jgi:AcrR family transcriptional regulator